MSLRSLARLFVLAVLMLGVATALAQSEGFPDSPAARQRQFLDLVEARARAIESAFPGFVPDVDFKLALRRQTACSAQATQLACYDAEQNTLTFDRTALEFLDKRLAASAKDYWVFYEHMELRVAFPLIAIIDGALWNAFMNEIAQAHHVSWPHEGCGSAQLAQRLACEMLVSGVDNELRVRHSRMYNANRLDRLWPDNLVALERSAWRSADRQYDEVRDLGGIQLLKPLIEEFGAARVIAYVAQTPFSIEDNNVRASALRYQERARDALAW
jgi:hypothetical protein